MNSRRKLLLIICAALTMTVAVAEAAQYPTRPIRLIVASAPGGNPDINSRNLANELSKQIGQQVVVENRPGASGIIGYEALARATPDGYTLGYLSNLIATNPSLYEKLLPAPIPASCPMERPASGRAPICRWNYSKP